MSAPLDFWFDFASPYGYLASTQIDDIAARHGRTVRWRPILLGAVFKVSGMKPVMDQPLRGEYLTHDAPRFARQHRNIARKEPPTRRSWTPTGLSLDTGVQRTPTTKMGRAVSRRTLPIISFR